MSTRLTRALDFVRAHGHDSSDVAPPSRHCQLARACCVCGASVETIVMGCSYIQRLARVDTRIEAALRTVTIANGHKSEIRVSLEQLAKDPDLRLFSIVYVIAIGIATKIHGKKLANFARSVLDGLDLPVSEDILYDVEAEILRRLGWRVQAIGRVDP